MRFIFLCIILFSLGLSFYLGVIFAQKNPGITLPTQNIKSDKKPLNAYNFETLRNTKIKASKITLGKVTKQTNTIVAQVFYFNVELPPGSGKTKRVSGQITRPVKAGTYPILVMHRGYYPPKLYFFGAGTRNLAEVFALNGYITLAADFLGFGDSQGESNDQLEARFQTYPTALTVLNSLDNVNPALEKAGVLDVKADADKVGIWGHSNGGHITLSVLAITGKPYPTVLWNPVSVAFPFSEFYYMDEDEAQDYKLVKDVRNFEKVYDMEKFNPVNYYHWITAPIQLNQGKNDEQVSIDWSNTLAEKLKKVGRTVEYNVYPDDHNFNQGSWNTVVQNNIEFFDKQLK